MPIPEKKILKNTETYILEMSEIIEIKAQDCMPFSNQDDPGFGTVVNQLISSKDHSVLHVKSTYNHDDSNIAEYNYSDCSWHAGRFVGEAYINANDLTYHVSIKPRFGNYFLFKLLEDAFNIRITQSQSEITKDDFTDYIKKIIGFIWANKLANANIHGLPREKTDKQNKGYTIRGKIDIRNSIKPYFLSGQLVSKKRVKIVDDTIAQILYQSFQILKREYDLDTHILPENAHDAIIEIERNVSESRYIPEFEYKNLRYKDVYLSYKSVVDLSWDIIKSKRLKNQQNKDVNSGYAFFIDIAELWEIYIRGIIKKNLAKDGWKVHSDEWIAYKKHFYKRALIPDIIAEKKDDIIVWDAKYKRMEYRSIDVDRADFFQIHTYLQFYRGEKNVLGGGLIYPISKKAVANDLYHKSILEDSDNEATFGVDGVNLTFLEDFSGSYQEAKRRIKIEEDIFLERINNVFIENELI